MMKKEQIEEYVYSFEPPAEVDFFTDKQKQTLDKETAKLRKTQEYLKAVSDNPSLGSKLDQDIATGVIYAEGEVSKVERRLRALEGIGERDFPSRSLVSPTGQRIIMSKHLADSLGFLTDGYILQDELDDLILGLKSEGVLDNQIIKATDAMKKYNAIVLQRGAFSDLKDLLTDVAEYDLQRIKPHFEVKTSPILPKVINPTPNAFSKELKREVTTPELKSFDEPRLPAPPSKPMPKPQPVPRISSATLNSKPAGDLPSISSVKFVDDLEKNRSSTSKAGRPK